MTDKTPEQRFRECIGVMEQIISDVRLSLDHLEADLAAFKREGPGNCQNHTGVDQYSELASTANGLSLLFDFYALLGTIHALTSHRKGLTEEQLYTFRLQYTNLVWMLDRYKLERKRWEQERLAQQAQGPTKGSMDESNWLQQLLGRMGK